MRDVTITFTLREKQEERLKRITEEYKNKYGLEMTEERMFTTIMLTGSFHDIDSKFKFHEWKLGLREGWK